MRRRNFLRDAGLLISSTTLLPALARAGQSSAGHYSSWSGIRDLFPLDPSYIHMAQMLLASHPKPVRDEIERHRQAFDKHPVTYWEDNWMEMEPRMCAAAAAYIGADSEEIVLTDSTSMGLSLLYSGFKLKPGDEILTTIHDHFATEKSLEYASSRNGATIRRVSLYTEPSTASVDEITSILEKAIQPATRIIALTWVHSCTGVKLPLKEIGQVISKANAQRSPANRIYYCVDGVHGFGVDNINIRDFGCDFFAAGTHKWIFGPRGTGILYGKKDAWNMITPVTPSFTGLPYGIWLGLVPGETPVSFRDLCTPGGFHSFEHRWALNKAFEFHQQIGKDKVEARTHALNTQLKEALRSNKHIKLHTPVSPTLSAGINCFEVDGIAPDEVVKKLFAKKIIASSSPYRVSYVRLTPCLVNNEEEVKTCI
ncbi:MAG TPA: aminotransferase class V-fold PLP-dependent enzyme, partial [Chitinophagaceae bacterium]|nr:aminotransferase class V-fold PLP-dependent enzyme [Chitinophagaceae bacterium]